MINLRYTVNGVSQEYEFADENIDEILARADAAFLPPLTAEDEIRYQEIVKRMEGKK